MFIVRKLTQVDTSQVERLDEVSGFDVLEWIESDSFGVFKEDTLVGYCTYGYADCYDDILNHHANTSESRMLSNVFVLPEYRKQKLSEKLIIKSRSTFGETIYLTASTFSLGQYYEKIGFIPMDEDYYLLYWPFSLAA